MNDIIKAIFLSDTCGVDKFRLPQDRAYTDLAKKEDELYQKLQASLSLEFFEIFSDFLDTLLMRHAIISEQYYTIGFKTGLRLATESLTLSDTFDV